jgi:hypothetical protein
VVPLPFSACPRQPLALAGFFAIFQENAKILNDKGRLAVKAAYSLWGKNRLKAVFGDYNARSGNKLPGL